MKTVLWSVFAVFFGVIIFVQIVQLKNIIISMSEQKYLAEQVISENPVTLNHCKYWTMLNKSN